MGKLLKEIAQQLKDSNKKVQLIYAFNGTGKTLLSHEFRELISSSDDIENETEQTEEGHCHKILYYNSHTEDLFYWRKQAGTSAEPMLLIQPNTFTDWILGNQGQDQKIVASFQRYTNSTIIPFFNTDFDKVKFLISESDKDDDPSSDPESIVLKPIKISKGEESNFIWSIFYSLFEQVIDVLSEPEPSERETNQFDQLQYIFIDDPVSSLDENHLIELAVNLAGLIKKSYFSNSQGIKYIVSTHNPLFYNVMFNELGSKSCYMFSKNEDGTFDLVEKNGDSNQSFSYHLFLKQTIEQAIEENNIQKYHFTLLRNLYEKTASFLGYPTWSELLPDDRQTYLNRIIQFTSHSTLSNETVAEPTEPEKQTVKLLLQHLLTNYNFSNR